MAYTKEQLRDIWRRTDGKCHLCGARHLLSDYTRTWEVDHSNPRAKGGGDWLSNYLVACIGCNRSKQASDNRAIRSQYGLPGKPPSAEEVQSRRRQARTWKGVGIAAAIVFGGSLALWALWKLISKLAESRAPVRPPPTTGRPGSS